MRVYDDVHGVGVVAKVNLADPRGNTYTVHFDHHSLGSHQDAVSEKQFSFKSAKNLQILKNEAMVQRVKSRMAPRVQFGAC